MRIMLIEDDLQICEVTISFGKDALNNGSYICPEKNNIPEVQQLYNDHRELAKEETFQSWVEMKLESAYVNKKDHTFIPHKGSMTLKKFDYDNVPENSESEYRILRTKEIDINIDDDNYELLELDNLTSKNYPVCTMFNFWGEEQDVLESFYNDCKFTKDGGSFGGYNGD